jgi:hypothetical protein
MEYAFAKSIAFVLLQIIRVCNKMKILHIPNELHLNYEGKARCLQARVDQFRQVFESSLVLFIIYIFSPKI